MTEDFVSATSTPRRPDRPVRAFLSSYGLEAAAAILFALACAVLFRFTAEDAFIVQRYASQFARGHGLVFNVGERISALTSPLHALLLTGLTLLLPSPMTAYKIIGAVAALLAVLYAARRLFNDVRERALFLGATLGSPFLAMWCVGGLETPLLLACLTVLAVLSLRMEKEAPSQALLFVFFIVSACCFILRHDSVVFVVPIAVAVLAKHWRQSIPGIVAAAVYAGTWTVFAWWYYGDLLPTSFYLKAVDMRPTFRGGLGYQLSFAVLCLFPLVVVRRPGWRGLPTAVWLSIVLFSILAAAVGHVHMMFGYRFYVPVIPAFVAYYMWLTKPSAWVRRWAFTVPLATNLVLLAIVHSYTVNPTVFHPRLFEPHYGFLSRLARRGFAYEYTQEGAAAYGDFIDALRNTGKAVLADAQARGISHSASLATIIAGATPNEILDVYVYDNLVGIRRNCPTLQRTETYRAADYIEFMVPRFGALDAQLGPLKETAIRVSDIPFWFDGRTEHMVLYFNPAALHTAVPARLHDPCPSGR